MSNSCYRLQCHVNKSCYRLQCHVNKSCYRQPCHVSKSCNRQPCHVNRSFLKKPDKALNGSCKIFYYVNKSWHHVNKAWAPACNVVDIWRRSCTTSSVITAMQRETLKKIVFTVKSDLQQNKMLCALECLLAI